MRDLLSWSARGSRVVRWWEGRPGRPPKNHFPVVTRERARASITQIGRDLGGHAHTNTCVFSQTGTLREILDRMNEGAESTRRKWQLAHRFTQNTKMRRRRSRKNPINQRIERKNEHKQCVQSSNQSKQSTLGNAKRPINQWINRSIMQ